MIDLDVILDPVDSDALCGLNLRELDHVNNLYIELKDKRIAAKHDERNTEEFCSNKFPRQWKEINDICIEILSKQSKDLDVLCWLIEAQLRVYGFAGLSNALKITNSLIEIYWDQLHPVEYDSLEERLASFIALNGKNGSGGLLQALRLAPLIPDMAFGRYGLWDYIKSNRSENSDLYDAISQSAAQAGQSAMLLHLEKIANCIIHLEAINASLDRLCAGNAPYMKDLSDLLHEAVRALRDINAANGFYKETTAPLLESNDLVVEQSPCHINAGTLQFQDRQEALRALFSVADFFRKTEPNSPLAPALETLVRRSNLSFAELLHDLMPDQSICAAVLTAAGITTEAICDQ